MRGPYRTPKQHHPFGAAAAGTAAQRGVSFMDHMLLHHGFTRQPKHPVFYGWEVLLALWLVYFLSTTPAAYGTSILSTQMVLENDMNEAVVGWGTSAFYASSMAFSVPASMIVQKFGFHNTLLGGSVMVLLACLAVALFPVPVPVYVALFLVMGIGGTLSGIVTGPGLVNAWFDQNKSLPMSLLMTAGALGGFAMPVVSAQLAERAGWKAGWWLYAALAAAAAVIALIFIKNSPAEVGEIRDGRAWHQTHDKAGEAQPETDAGGLTITEALRSREFPTISVVLFGVRLLFTGCTSYTVLYAVQRGISPLQAATALSCFHIFGLMGRLAAGLRSRIKLLIHLLVTGCYAGMFAGGLILWQAQGIALFYAAAALIGFFYNCSYTLLALMIPEYFGSKNYSIFFGTLNTICSAGSTAAPLLISLLAGVFGGSYASSFLVVTIVTGLCALAMLLTPSRYRTGKKA